MRKKIKKWSFTFFLVTLNIFFSAIPALSVLPDEILPDPLLEKRARKLSSEFRCPVCANETIDSSSTSLAHDLRLLIRQQLLEGASDNHIIYFIIQRYGDYALLKPNFSLKNLPLWLSPPFILLCGTFFIYTRVEKSHPSSPSLTLEEKEKLKIILQQDIN